MKNKKYSRSGRNPGLCFNSQLRIHNAQLRAMHNLQCTMTIKNSQLTMHNE
ncbi:hypothetical protein H2684_01745 [Clostridium sp. cel8]|uniref:hypothetical protein n=1 Tax=Clostridium sp. cel8 TaxID=2663123 RepID=UPI0015F5EC0E|nr:hypothetical protein [Clostridium sp. cel8]MBA5850041.1 hypothetical protein [Clostridium sp. cel8]